MRNQSLFFPWSIAPTNKEHSFSPVHSTGWQQLLRGEERYFNFPVDLALDSAWIRLFIRRCVDTTYCNSVGSCAVIMLQPEREREGEREREREGGGGTERERGRWKEREREGGRGRERQTDRQTDRQRQRQIVRQRTQKTDWERLREQVCVCVWGGGGGEGGS